MSNSQRREIPQSLSSLSTKHIVLNQDVIEIGKPEELTTEQRDSLREFLRSFCPWKKGPWRIFGIDIDSEWRSDWKWVRILPHLQALKNKRVLDIGCHNGYFMFRMLAEQPAFIKGIDPQVQQGELFNFLKMVCGIKQIEFETKVLDQVDDPPESYDQIFFLGVLYHLKDPIGGLLRIKELLAPGGTLYLDCQGVPGEESTALVPTGRYAGASGMWFLPTASCLKNMLVRTGFRDVQCFFSEPLSVDEQRATDWAQIKSLGDFLSTDRKKTIEGYPAPWRFYFRAVK